MGEKSRRRPPYIGLIAFVILILANMICRCVSMDKESGTASDAVIPAKEDMQQSADSLSFLNDKLKYDWLEE